VPIAQVVEVYALMMVVGEAVPAKTMAELISFARANPGKLTMGYSGFGNPAHILGELLNRREKLGLQLVSYKGTVDTQNDLMAGRISMMTAPLTNVAEAVKSGKLKVLAAVGDKRNPLAPEVPTLTEIGIRELAFALWSGFHAPAGTPAAVLARAERGVEAGTKAPQAADRLRAISAAPAYLSGAQFAEVIKRDSATIRKMLDDSGIKEQARRNEGQK
jgi:tripartite-type tricarboxylate transporter receptor subunit TctC